LFWIGLKEGLAQADPYLFHVTGFTLLQAGLSTFLSLLLAIPVARALARRRFRGRRIIIRLLALPLALPAIVTVLGITEIYGNRGWLGGLFDIYGLQGILLAHVFFNFPIATRMLLLRLAAVPPESWRLAAQLGFGGRDVWWRIEWPQIRAALPGAATLIFLLCAVSFTVVLTLGGGPKATTLEVAIYQALRFDFDPQRAAGLAVVQLAICSILVLFVHRLGGGISAWQSFRWVSTRYNGPALLARLGDFLAIILGLAILIPPIAAVFFSGITHLHFGANVAAALATSLAIGVCSASLSMIVCWPLAQAAVRRAGWNKLSALAVVLGLIMPPAVLATGWFLLLARFPAFSVPAPMLVVAMSALTALPFVYNTLAPAVADSARQHDRLCASLGVAGFPRFLRIDLPYLGQAIGFSFLMAAIVSLGDLTAILFFGSQGFTTLPALIYRQMGSYRMETADGTALILAVFTLSLVMVAERWSGRDD
jgi:thiamine transport system permease protein